jgi:hypothetical protein
MFPITQNATDTRLSISISRLTGANILRYRFSVQSSGKAEETQRLIEI